MTKRITFGFAVAALMAGLAANAAAPKADFEALDKNRDGKISLNEATEHDALFVAFEKLDTNKDGELTREEFAKW